MFSEENQLMPHPGRIFRRQALLDLARMIAGPDAIRRRGCLKGKSYLEIGCGTGIFAYEFYRMGCQTYIYDLSKEIVQTADRIFNSDKKRLHILKNLGGGDFDIVAAYSVLEHIEDDREMLEYWGSFVRPGGTLLLSVPAREKYWSSVDDVAGHLRRYEKEELLYLFQKAGMEVETCISIGFPFQVVISRLTDVLVWRKRLRALKGLSNRERTALSGTVSRLYGFHKILPYRMLAAMARFQRIFYNTDWGVDFIVVVKKSDETEKSA